MDSNLGTLQEIYRKEVIRKTVSIKNRSEITKLPATPKYSKKTFLHKKNQSIHLLKQKHTPYSQCNLS